MHTQENFQFLQMHTQKNFLRCIAILIILGLSVSLIGIAPQAAEACPAAIAICTGVFGAAGKHCGRPDTSTWSCIAAMAAASGICALAWVACGSS